MPTHSNKLILFLLLFCGLTQATVSANTTTLHYAQNFTVRTVPEGKLVEISNATRDDAGKIQQQLLLMRDQSASPKAYPKAIRIQIPLQRVAVQATPYIPHFVELGVIDTLIGISDVGFVNAPEAVERIRAGKIQSIGRGSSVNTENLLVLQPELFITDAVGDLIQDSYAVITRAGIPVVFSAGYMETHPLGRAEWVKFTALFFDKEAEAEALFSKIADHYHALEAKARNVSYQPTVFFNIPWGGVWYMPGGRSYKAQLIKSAGGRYLWAEDTNTGSLPLEFESVFNRVLSADVWLDTSEVSSLDALANRDRRYRKFKAWQTQSVYNNNRRLNMTGGNDFYERGALHPDEVLADYIRILHPELLPAHTLIYHQRLTQDAN